MGKRLDDTEPAEDSKAMMYFTGMRWLIFILGPLQMSTELALFQESACDADYQFYFPHIILPYTCSECDLHHIKAIIRRPC
jgi:hypothetical protein